MYKIRVKRRFFFGFRTIWVTSHYIEWEIRSSDDMGQPIKTQTKPYLCLVRADGVIEFLPNVEKLHWQVYRKVTVAIGESHGKQIPAAATV